MAAYFVLPVLHKSHRTVLPFLCMSAFLNCPLSPACTAFQCAALACTALSRATAAGHDGSIIFWLLGQSDALAKVEGAHENQINSLAFHPVGHMMTTCERGCVLQLSASCSMTLVTIGRVPPYSCVRQCCVLPGVAGAFAGLIAGKQPVSPRCLVELRAPMTFLQR